MAIILLFIYSIIPVGILLTLSIGYTLSLQNDIFSAIMMAIFSIAALKIEQNKEKREVTWVNQAVILLLLPISLLNWLCYVLLSGWNYTILCMAICSICAGIYLKKYIQKKVLRRILFFLCFLLFIPVSFVSFFDWLFQDFGRNTVIQTLDSSDGNYRAAVICHDQGILGGDVVVEVYQVQTKMNFYIFQIWKKPKRVYFGDWAMYQDIKICWVEEDALSINGVVYRMD